MLGGGGIEQEVICVQEKRKVEIRIYQEAQSINLCLKFDVDNCWEGY